MKSFLKSHESIIRNVCEELNVHDKTVVDDIVKKLLNTSYSTVKPKKDPNRVKKAKSCYLFFCDEKRKEVQIQNPGKNMGEISKLLGKLWKEITSEEKTKYNDMYLEDVLRYENER